MLLYVLLGALALLLVASAVALIRAELKQGKLSVNIEGVVIGAVTNFFDTLGIGAFAPTTAWLKFRKLVPDKLIPGTLNVGHTLPVIVQSAIFLVILGVHVEPILLGACLAAALVGALVGVPLVIRAPVRLVQAVMGVALVIAAVLFSMSNLHLMPIGGNANGLEPPLLYIAIAAHFFMGMMMPFGIGLYAPSLIVLSLCGLDPRLAFPIMTSACAFLMPITGFRFISTGRADFKVCLGIALGGIPAVLIAAFIVKEMPIETLRWVVVGVVLYAAALLLRSALKAKDEDAAGSI